LVFPLVRRQQLLVIVSVAALVAVFFVPRIPQDPAYHRFVDARTLLGVPNFWNVLSNVGYLLVGLYGLADTRSHHSVRARRDETHASCVWSRARWNTSRS